MNTINIGNHELWLKKLTKYPEKVLETKSVRNKNFLTTALQRKILLSVLEE